MNVTCPSCLGKDHREATHRHRRLKLSGQARTLLGEVRLGLLGMGGRGGYAEKEEGMKVGDGSSPLTLETTWSSG